MHCSQQCIKIPFSNYKSALGVLTMRIFSSIVAYLLVGGSALANTAISLSPMEGEKSPDVVATRNVTGSCGSSIVRVLGVTDVIDNFYGIDLDAGKIIIRSGLNKELILGADSGVLSDHNGVACVSTKSGSRLLIWSNCSGSACGDNFSFFVIDPERLVFLAPKDPRKGQCDDSCASQLLGNKLPKRINGY
jgi:hypothetical protein